jgi:hypothetical protein
MKALRTVGLLMVFVQIHAVAGTQQTNQSVYAAVPKHLRSRLDARLQLVVEYTRDKKPDKLYDLFSSEHLADLKSIERINDKSQYVLAIRRLGSANMDVVDFSPLSTIKLVTRRIDRAYVIFGWVKFRVNGKVVQDKGSIVASWKNGEWYFSEFGIEIDE